MVYAMDARKDEENNKKRIICVFVLFLIAVLLYILFRSFGYIENKEVLIPTGNVDIFEIGCACCCKANSKKEPENATVPNTHYDNSNNVEEPVDISSDECSEPDEKIRDLGDVIVYDDYKVWDNKELRIFSNPAYEYRHIIAPGSLNSYAFIIRNNNDYDIVVDILFNEVNDKNINMQYKLKNEGNYLIGSASGYDTLRGKKIENVELPAESYKSYVLDWKWVDSSNDTVIGFDASSFYKLTITIAAK